MTIPTQTALFMTCRFLVFTIMTHNTVLSHSQLKKSRDAGQNPQPFWLARETVKQSAFHQLESGGSRTR